MAPIHSGNIKSVLRATPEKENALPLTQGVEVVAK